MKPLSKPRKGRTLPKGIYLWNLETKKYSYTKYRACIKVDGRTKTMGYFSTLSEACKHFIKFHEEIYGTKPHWYAEYIRTYQFDLEELS